MAVRCLVCKGESGVHATAQAARAHTHVKAHTRSHTLTHAHTHTHTHKALTINLQTCMITKGPNTHTQKSKFNMYPHCVGRCLIQLLCFARISLPIALSFGLWLASHEGGELHSVYRRATKAARCKVMIAALLATGVVGRCNTVVGRCNTLCNTFAGLHVS